MPAQMDRRRHEGVQTLALGSKSMSIAMKLAWLLAKFTGISILIVSSVMLRLVWALFFKGGS